MTLQLSDLYNGGLRALDSATKYPSIPTYHSLDTSRRKAPLLDENPIAFHGAVWGHEKVDGTNGRIVVLPRNSGWLIGSRDELLTAVGDLVVRDTLSIVVTLSGIAERLANSRPDEIVTAYLEVYGQQGEAATQYGDRSASGARLFDVSIVPAALLDRDVEAVARWRDYGGQQWLNEDELDAFAERQGVERAPELFGVPSTMVPTTVTDMRSFMEPYATTRAHLNGQPGRSEGFVLSTTDRRTKAKVRFADYDRTLKLRAEAAAK
ncbi:RNA ligase family protein [Nonomuraea sp. NPDC050556]|uniref:RNA ligase family protein n=1 Tax=Nonomuraea sp. NPDC050556 TaxID=3364369 RepID=UPI003794DBE7